MQRGIVMQTIVFGAALVLAVASSARTSRAAEPKAPASTAAERQARGDAAARAFLTGKYEDALHIYSELYIASDGRPEYLRNIGRCQQKLKQYDLAIDTFRDYLRRMKKISAEERREVEGFISEIETARLNQASGGADKAEKPAETPPPAPPPVVAAPQPAPAQPAPLPPIYTAPAPQSPAPAPAPTYPQPTQPQYGYPAQGYQQAPAPSGTLTTTTPPPAPPRRKSSAMKVVGIVGIVVGAVVLVSGVSALALSRSTYDAAKKDGCPNTGTDCATKADTVDVLNTTSKALFIAGGAIGILGVTLVVVAPSSTPARETQVGLGFTGRF
jgi:hypothetical protein